jgi:hypothetical protein
MVIGVGIHASGEHGEEEPVIPARGAHEELRATAGGSGKPGGRGGPSGPPEESGGTEEESNGPSGRMRRPFWSEADDREWEGNPSRPVPKTEVRERWGGRVGEGEGGEAAEV